MPGGQRLVNTTQQVGNALGVALLNTIAATAAASYVASHGSSAVARAAALVHGYTTALYTGPVFHALGAVVSLLLARARRQNVAGGGERSLTELAEII